MKIDGELDSCRYEAEMSRECRLDVLERDLLTGHLFEVSSSFSRWIQVVRICHVPEQTPRRIRQFPFAKSCGEDFHVIFGTGSESKSNKLADPIHR